MSSRRKRDFHVIYTDEPLPRSPSAESDMSAGGTPYDQPGSQVRKASIAVGPSESGLSFTLDMDPVQTLEHSSSLHEDIEKLFEQSPGISLTALIASNAECLPWERSSLEVPVPASERCLEEYDITSHRRSSFPHIHVPLKSLHNHSVKSLASTAMGEPKGLKRKKKKKSKNKTPRKSKSLIFPSRCASISASIPEVEKEEYSESDDSRSSYESENDGDENDNDEYDDENEEGEGEEEDESSHLLGNAEREHVVDYEAELDKLEKNNELYISETDLSRTEDLVVPNGHGSQPIESDVAPASNEPIAVPVTERPADGGSFDNSHLRLPWTIGDADSNKSDPSIAPGLFYIGSEIKDVPSPAMSAASSVGLFPGIDVNAPIVVVLNNDSRPLVSTSIREAIPQAHNMSFLQQQAGNKVKFLLDVPNLRGSFSSQMTNGCEEMEGSDIQDVQNKFHNSSSDSNNSDDDEDGDDDVRRHLLKQHSVGSYPEEDFSGPETSAHDSHLYPHTTGAGQHGSPHIQRSRSKHRHRHHENYLSQDLQRRRTRGSEVQMSDALSRVPTVTELDEAATLQSADLDDMASHRMDDLQGIRKHKIGRKKHKTSGSIKVYGGKSDKPRRKYHQPKKKFDHTPHEVFVELDELFVQDNHEIEWREKARWIKFEEDVEEGAERWGKPHVASLSFHSLLELRKGLESGTLLLDLEATDLIGIAHRIVEDMVIHDQITTDCKGQVMRTILTKHKFVSSDTTVKSLLTRQKSSMDLLAMDERHQKESSLMKTLSHISLSHIPSSSNLQHQASQNHLNGNGNHLNGNNHSNHLTVPGSSSNHQTSHRSSSPHAGSGIAGSLQSLLNIGRKKKDKEGKQKESGTTGGPGRLEMVKVDVDNNIASEDGGLHIAVVPKEEDREHHKMSLMRRIPRDAEACTVLVGCVDYLSKPAMAFVRLAEKQILDNLTEVPLPVRFLFVLLGPKTKVMDYHEVGRSISSLMSNQHFHEVAYKAETRSEILHAINEFLNESIVLPPGDWDQKTLLPVMDMARKRAKIRRKKQKKKEELQKLLEMETKDKIPMDPLKRTGRPFGGLINDMRRRYPHYISDFKDALSLQCVTALTFIFFACLCPCIAFGGLYGEKTYSEIGVVETIVATATTNMVFAVFSGQPLILYGATGPVLLFEKHLWMFCKEYGIEFLTWRVWIGIWVFIITAIVIAAEGSFIVKYITRFTEEVFAILISLIFINEVIQKIIQVYKDHPLRGKEFYCNNLNSNHSEDLENITNLIANISTSTFVPTPYRSDDVMLGLNSTLSSHSTHSTVHGTSHYSEKANFNEPNTALLSTILILGTFFIAYFLRIFRNSRFLGRSARRALGDFGIFLAIILMVLFDYICADTYTQKLAMPTEITTHTGGQSNWFVNPMGVKEPMKIVLMISAVIPAFLIFLLLFLELQLTQMLLHKNTFMLKKGTGFHLDQFLLGLIILFCSLFGLPWMCPATVRSVAHVSSLAVMSQTHAPGEKPKLLEVRDQRVTNIVMNILIGSTLFWGDVLRRVPIAVLFGVLLYLGVSAISGVQFYKRIKLLFMPVKHHPGKSYVRQVKTVKMHVFTGIQLVLVGILWAVKSTVVAIAFPLFVFLMVPLRLLLMPKYFTHEELEALDKEEEDSDDEEDADPDFYQLAHMPV
ncbi:anion exchange protein 2-like isoform X2 [Dreissena polymorpha]|uniref:anion exchange protein 2-like isoform X2 n=1 Tax=Dreissena polymorpha TaxID=45954 RepID=UPI0022651940|nr:anion exchange protein 2-like isoform X2 [Dreissena polymorpha]XP_052235492.1 anion exchange protein 2-like isoform X2 [Dreissena polymorpha]